MTEFSQTGLLLLGHGSHFNPDSSAPIHEHADRIRAAGLFAEVRAGFWKEEPAICRSLELFDSEEIVVVPVFMSSGYFTEEVMPRELGIPGPGRHVAKGRVISYTAPVGAHPSLANVIVQRTRDAGATGGEALVVLGHGTPRNLNSEKNIYLQAERVREMEQFHEVATAFLDQEPGLEQILSLVNADEIVVVPLFVADGWHVAETIPRDLDLAGGENVRGGRRLRFAAAVGTHKQLTDVIESLAREALPGAESVERVRAESLEIHELKRILSGGAAMFGELGIAARENGVIIKGPSGGARPPVPADFNEFRKWARFDDDGEYRPLSGSRSLRSGWVIECQTAEEAAKWIEIIYPAALRHAALCRQGRLNIIEAPAALDRQTGRYERAREVDDACIRRCANALCTQCVRDPAWLDGPKNSPIPCPEPCSVFVSLAREAAHWGENDIPEDHAAPAIGFADFETPTNFVRKRFFYE